MSHQKSEKELAVVQPLSPIASLYIRFQKRMTRWIPPLPSWCATSLLSGSVVGDDLKNMGFTSDVKNGAPEMSPKLTNGFLDFSIPLDM